MNNPISNLMHYKSYYATFNNDILNIYSNSNKLLTSRTYDKITYTNQRENEFHNIADRYL